MAELLPPLRLPNPYPEMDSGQWNAYQVLQNFQYVTGQLTAVRRTLGGGIWSNPLTTLGDLMRAQEAGLPTRLPIGTTGQVLAVATGLPTWSALGPLVHTMATIPYAASMTPDAALGIFQRITVPDGTAFTINAPTNPVPGQPLTLTIRNTSGGALGVVTWDPVFKLAAWTQPATANSRSVSFVYDGTNWVEYGRTPADVPN
jgi:hypothetical protein